jgi:peptide chain release factor 1
VNVHESASRPNLLGKCFWCCSMIDKLEGVVKRYDELTRLMGEQEVARAPDIFRKYAKEHSELEAVVHCFLKYQKATEELKDAKELVETSDDEQMRQLAQSEAETLKARQEELYQELIVLLIPKDPSDEKNIILEIRAGTGGDEAALFAGDLFSMYSHYAERKRWKIEIIASSGSSVGGFKEVICQIIGKGAYSRFKYESGVHRVQRVPTTETQGRIHTSTVTVAVLPEAEEVEIEIQDKDLRIDVYRSSGPGGQSVNTTDSAVRVTHLPSGMVVICQDEKSQLKNKNKALMVLRSRLLEMKRAEQEAERSQNRRSQIGSGERSEKIRTYNFPQGRVTDHRIGLTLYQLETVLGGNLDPVVEPLAAHYRAEALEGVG